MSESDENDPDEIDGYPRGSLGYEIRRIRAEAEALGAGGLVDQVDALDAHNHQRAADVLARASLKCNGVELSGWLRETGETGRMTQIRRGTAESDDG